MMLANSALDVPVLNPFIVTESAYEEDAEDDLADLGIRLGKLRISDRIGGFFRPRMVEEVSILLCISGNDMLNNFS